MSHHPALRSEPPLPWSARTLAGMLAIVVHVLFFVVLVLSVNWHSEDTAPVAVEMWSPSTLRASMAGAVPPTPLPPAPQPVVPQPAPQPEPTPPHAAVSAAPALLPPAASVRAASPAVVSPAVVSLVATSPVAAFSVFPAAPAAAPRRPTVSLFPVLPWHALVPERYQD